MYSSKMFIPSDEPYLNADETDHMISAFSIAKSEKRMHLLNLYNLSRILPLKKALLNHVE